MQPPGRLKSSFLPHTWNKELISLPLRKPKMGLGVVTISPSELNWTREDWIERYENSVLDISQTIKEDGCRNQNKVTVPPPAFSGQFRIRGSALRKSSGDWAEGRECLKGLEEMLTSGPQAVPHCPCQAFRKTVPVSRTWRMWTCGSYHSRPVLPTCHCRLPPYVTCILFLKGFGDRLQSILY